MFAPWNIFFFNRGHSTFAMSPASDEISPAHRKSPQSTRTWLSEIDPAAFPLHRLHTLKGLLDAIPVCRARLWHRCCRPDRSLAKNAASHCALMQLGQKHPASAVAMPLQTITSSGILPIIPQPLPSSASILSQVRWTRGGYYSSVYFGRFHCRELLWVLCSHKTSNNALCNPAGLQQVE